MALVREAGIWEKFHIARSKLQLDADVMVAATYTVTADDHKLDETRLFPALRKVILEHSALSVYITDEDEVKPKLNRLDKVDLSKCVRFVEGTQVTDAIEEEMTQHFDTQSALPLWRITVLDGKTVLFAFHHAVIDGISATIFHRSLLSALNSGDTEYAGAIVETNASISHPPPTEGQMLIRLAPAKLLGVVLGNLTPAAFKSITYAWTGAPISNGLRTKGKAFFLHLPLSLGDSAVICRRHGTSVTAFLSTVFAQSLSTALADIKPQPKTIPVVLPISLRPFSNIDTKSLVMDCISGYRTSFSHPYKMSWAKAASFHKELKSNASSTRDSVGLLRALTGKYDGYFQGQFNKKRENAFEVSNLGAFKTQAGAEWNIERLWFCHNNAVVGPAIQISAVGNPDGSLSIAFTWSEGVVDDQIVRSAIDNFEIVYKQLLNE